MGTQPLAVVCRKGSVHARGCRGRSRAKGPAYQLCKGVAACSRAWVCRPGLCSKLQLELQAEHTTWQQRRGACRGVYALYDQLMSVVLFGFKQSRALPRLRPLCCAWHAGQMPARVG